jgi:hypothetical protein
MTVQTHNYMLESPPEFKRAPRIIQFPIVQMKNNSSPTATIKHSSSSSSLSSLLNSSSTTTPASYNQPSRITEIHGEEDDDDSMNDTFNNKDVG